MAIFVLGGTGFIGIRVIPLLVARGETVVCMDINPNAPTLASLGDKVSIGGQAVVSGQAIVVGTMTVQGSAFSVGGATFTVAAGSITLGGQLNAASAGIKWADGTTSTTAA